MAVLDRYPLFQQAYLVNDLESFDPAVEPRVRRRTVRRHAPPQDRPLHVSRHRQEADVTYAFGYLGDDMIQFIQQHDDTPSIYRDMYRTGEEGYHHVGVLVND